MSDYAGKRSRIASEYGHSGAKPDLAPGKRTLVEALQPTWSRAPAVGLGAGKRMLVEMLPQPEIGPEAETPASPSEPVQRKVDASPTSVENGTAESHTAAIHESAQQGTATPFASLPYREKIMHLFGRPHMSEAPAHTGLDPVASAPVQRKAESSAPAPSRPRGAGAHAGAGSEAASVAPQPADETHETHDTRAKLGDPGDQLAGEAPVTEAEPEGEPAEGAADDRGVLQAYHGDARPTVGSTADATPTSTGIPAAVQAKMERAFQTDFSGVRVHTNSSKASAMGAVAAAQGNDLHFAPGAYQPDTPDGQQVLGHELAHVVQQRAGRVAGIQGAGATTLNVDRALEHEADEAGKRAAQGQTVSLSGGGSSAAGSQVVQPMLGFEIEMLVLIDTNGRPLPEKTRIGTCGAHLDLDIDHGPAVAAPTPTPAADARYDVDQRANGVAPGAEVEMRRHGGPADPRLPMQELDPAIWAATTNAPVFTRPASPVYPHVNNAALALIDAAVLSYDFNYKNWEVARAQNDLNTIILQCAAWLVANTHKPNKVFHPHRRARWRAVRNALRDLSVRAQAHLVFWTNPLHAAPPVNLRRDFRRPGGVGWHQYNPRAGMGTDHYASILEIVTHAYAPETPAGRANIVAAMNDAVTLAANIDAAMTPARNRVQLNTIAGVAGVGNAIHVGNPAQPAQTTDGSIQCTGAIDLAQFPSYVLSMTGTGGPGIAPNGETNTEFHLKHHDDVDQDEGRLVLNELPQAVADATAVVNAIKALHGGGAPDMVNLRGLVTLICQYLRMGRHFYNGVGHPLDKNIVPLLSRTDLSQIYDRLVPAPEKAWLAQGGAAGLNHLLLHLPAGAGRAPASDLFNDNAESHNGALSCATFVSNVFTQLADGVTGSLGGFHKMPTEDVDPAGARNGDSRSLANHPRTGVPAPHREGFVFEMRNMVKDQNVLGRFPRTHWLKLAEQQTAVFSSLNARSEAHATADQRTRYSGDRGGVGAPRRFNVQTGNDPNW